MAVQGNGGRRIAVSSRTLLRRVHQAQQPASRRFLILISRDHDHAVPHGSDLFRVQYARPSAEHARARHEHGRPRLVQQCPPVFHGLHRPDFIAVKRFLTFQYGTSQLSAKIGGVQAVHPADFPHHAVHIHGDFGNEAIAYAAFQKQQNLLGTPKCKAWNQYLSSVLYRLSHQLHKPPLLHLAIGMQLISVGGLGNNDIRSQFRNPDAFNGLLGKGGKVSGIEKRAFRCLKIQAGRACDMACRIKGRPDAR